VQSGLEIQLRLADQLATLYAQTISAENVRWDATVPLLQPTLVRR
jgi:hypothetical protein